MKRYFSLPRAASVTAALAAFCFAVTGLTVGCSGSSQKAPTASVGTPQDGRKASAKITVQWPERTNTRLIPAASNSLRVTLQHAEGFSTAQVAARPADGSPSTLNFVNLPPGAFTITATAHPDAEGNGLPAQASGAQTVEARPDETFTLDITLGSTIDRLAAQVAPGSVEVGQSATATASAQNAAGELVVTGSTYTWTTSDAAIATVAAAGATAAVSAVAPGTVTLTATETESGKSASVALTVTTTPVRVYVSDVFKDRIVEATLNDDGTVSQYKTRRFNPANPADALDGPSGVFVDGAGAIYVVDNNRNRIVRMNGIDGEWTTLGVFGNGVKEFREPNGIWVDTNGQIYVVDTGNRRVVRFDNMNGDNWTAYGPVNSNDARFLSVPIGISMDAQKRIYITDNGGAGSLKRIRDLGDTNPEVFTSNRDYDAVQFISVAADGRIYVADRPTITRMDDLNRANFQSYSGPTTATLINPSQAVADSKNRVYITNTNRDRVARINDMQGNGYVDFTGPAGDPFNGPYGIFVVEPK